MNCSIAQHSNDVCDHAAACPFTPWRVRAGLLACLLALALPAAVHAATAAPPTFVAGALTGSYYTQTLVAIGAAPITWSVTRGALPAGLSLGSSTGIISGTPTAPGIFAFTIAATNAGGSISEPLSLTVSSPPTPPSIVTASPLSSALTGAPYSQTIAATGTTPITWSVKSGALPPGLSLGSSNGIISGTPTAAGVFTFAVSATNAGGSNAKSLNLTVNTPPGITTTSPLSAAVKGSPYTQTLAATGTAPIAWSVTSGALPAGLSLGSSSGIIAGTPAAQGVFTSIISATNAGGSSSRQFSLTVNAPVPPSIVTVSPLPSALTGAAYWQTLAASGTTPITWAVTSGTLPAGLTLNSSTGTIAGNPTAAGAVTFGVSATNAFGTSSRQLTLTVNATPSMLTASPLPAAQLGTPYSQALIASGTTPITWAVTSGALPTGLTLNNSTGAISGTPTVSGVASFAISVSNAFGENSASLSLTVSSANSSCDSGITFSGPIVISAGGSYTGNWESTNPAIPAVTIHTNAPVTILNSTLRGPGDILSAMWNNQLTVRNNCFVGTNPNVRNTAKGSPIHMDNPTNVVIEHNDFQNTGGSGIFIQEYWGNFTTANTIRVRYNRFRNVDGRYSDGAGGYLTGVSGYLSHAIQFALTRNVPGIEISWNEVINQPYQSRVEDSISIYSSSGTPSSPLLVHDNYVQGQYAANPATPDALGYSGTGIVTDDEANITDPTKATSWVKIYNNQVVSIGLGGIGICAGHDNEMYNNRVVSNGQLADGTKISGSNAAGIVTNNWRNEPAGVYGNNSIHDNVSGVRRYAYGAWVRNDYYLGVAPTFALNNAPFVPATAAAPTLASESGELSLWNQKLTDAGISVGSTLVILP